MSLPGQVAVITGAGSGIGRAISLNLAQAGARLALLGRNRETLEATKTALGPNGESAFTSVCDVTDLVLRLDSRDRRSTSFSRLPAECPWACSSRGVGCDAEPPPAWSWRLAAAARRDSISREVC